LISDIVILALNMLAAGAILTVIGWVVVMRPALAMIFFFVFFAFVWRLLSVVYIDVFTPFSEQLERSIGPGLSAVPLVISQAIVIAAVLFSFRRSRWQALHSNDRPPLAVLLAGGRTKLSDVAFFAVTLFCLALWGELLVNGPIPLFVAMERFDYTQLYGGFLHQRLMEWGPMLAFQLGVFLVAPTLNGGQPDRRFGGLFATLLLYLFLVGHRFSSFYAYGSFFVIPIGAALLRQATQDFSERRLFTATVLRSLAIAGAGAFVLIGFAVSYSYLVVRGEGSQFISKLAQRILVQQGEMWWMTYERVFTKADWDAGLAAYKLLVDPFDPNRNSTMQFLMERALSLDRAWFILDQGSAYTGGWPEVFFELGGPYIGLALVAFSAIVFSEFMFLMSRCIVQERFATCFFLTPILYAVTLTIVSGMVNSFIQVTFVIKAALAIIVYVVEEKWRSALMESHAMASIASTEGRS
jgi:Family of unknown function (DUF6418)